MSSDITQAQQEFITMLKKKLSDQFSNQLDGTFEMMNVPNGFYWGIQFGPNNFYNQKSLNQVDLQAIEGSNGLLTVGDSNFTTLYNSVLGSIAYQFSEEDQKQMQQPRWCDPSRHALPACAQQQPQKRPSARLPRKYI